MRNKCLTCGKDVKNKYCNVSCQNINQKKGKKLNKSSLLKRSITKSKKWKEFKVSCFICGKHFNIHEYNTSKPKKEKYFCSKSCANVRIWTYEKRLKLSNSAKKSEKVKIANKILAKNNKGFRILNGKKVSSIENIETECLYCGNVIIHKKNLTRKYHSECWLKCSGGLREGSSRGKSGYYKGYKCDSSYELAWVIYQLEHNQKFERNLESFDYEYKGIKHKYYPDFILSDKTYIEIKNFKSDLTDAKIKNFPYNINVLYKEDMKKIFLPYVIDKYGKNFISLYEKV